MIVCYDTTRIVVEVVVESGSRRRKTLTPFMTLTFGPSRYREKILAIVFLRKVTLIYLKIQGIQLFLQHRNAVMHTSSVLFNKLDQPKCHS